MIMSCITFVSFQILLNSVPTRAFTPERDIRQSDLLSMYIFLLCSEGFFALIWRSMSNQLWARVPFGSARLSLTICFFADDSLLFQEASDCGPDVLLSVIEEYEKLWRQKINLSKSSIYFPLMLGVRSRSIWLIGWACNSQVGMGSTWAYPT